MTPRPDVLVTELERLARDVGDLVPDLRRRCDAVFSDVDVTAISRVYLVGCGDSYHASIATELAFTRFAGVECRAVSGQRFVEYISEQTSDCSSDTLAVVTSASGKTPPALEAITQARHHGMTTIGITTMPASTLTAAADHHMVTALTDKEPSPGLRTFQAALVALLLVAIGMGDRRRRQTRGQSSALCDELAAMGNAIEITSRTMRPACESLATMLAGTPAVIVLGSGPNLGTARFAAAKIVEASGLLAVGQDLDEWWHVERFAGPRDMPTVVLAPPGRSRAHAGRIAEKARALGRRTIIVAAHDDELLRDASTALPIPWSVREEFSPMLYHLFSAWLANFLRVQMARPLFWAGTPPHDARRADG